MLKKEIHIRDLKKSDLPVVKQIIDDNQMFPSEYLDEMTTEYFEQVSEELWVVAETSQRNVVAVAYCAPERMTEGTWNLLLIAVFKSFQGVGIGSDLISWVEHALKKKNARILLVETSSFAEYELTRQFYPKCKYKQVAVIPEYYDQGEDKVVFWKALNE